MPTAPNTVYGGAGKTIASSAAKVVAELGNKVVEKATGNIVKKKPKLKNIGYNNVDYLIKSAGKLERKKSAYIGYIKGDAKLIYNELTKGGRLNKLTGAHTLKDRTHVYLHFSRKSKKWTIDIKPPNSKKPIKIRVE